MAATISAGNAMPSSRTGTKITSDTWNSGARKIWSTVSPARCQIASWSSSNVSDGLVPPPLSSNATPMLNSASRHAYRKPTTAAGASAWDRATIRNGRMRKRSISATSRLPPDSASRYTASSSAVM